MDGLGKIELLRETLSFATTTMMLHILIPPPPKKKKSSNAQLNLYTSKQSWQGLFIPTFSKLCDFFKLLCYCECFLVCNAAAGKEGLCAPGGHWQCPPSPKDRSGICYLRQEKVQQYVWRKKGLSNAAWLSTCRDSPVYLLKKITPCFA